MLPSISQISETGKSSSPTAISIARQWADGQKDMLMRVGFEPTPFRTSDCVDEATTNGGHLKLAP